MKAVITGTLLLLCVLIVAPVCSRALMRLAFYPARLGSYAVFLTNGQVYFGTMAGEDESRVVLRDIYYVQTKNGNASGTDASLVKLGNEFHGPEDRMEISRPQILFIEPLKTDGTVAKAIEHFRASSTNVK